MLPARREIRFVHTNSSWELFIQNERGHSRVRYSAFDKRSRCYKLGTKMWNRLLPKVVVLVSVLRHCLAAHFFIKHFIITYRSPLFFPLMSSTFQIVNSRANILSYARLIYQILQAKILVPQIFPLVCFQIIRDFRKLLILNHK